MSLHPLSSGRVATALFSEHPTYDNKLPCMDGTQRLLIQGLSDCIVFCWNFAFQYCVHLIGVICLTHAVFEWGFYSDESRSTVVCSNWSGQPSNTYRAAKARLSPWTATALSPVGAGVTSTQRRPIPNSRSPVNDTEWRIALLNWQLNYRTFTVPPKNLTHK